MIVAAVTLAAFAVWLYRYLERQHDVITGRGWSAAEERRRRERTGKLYVVSTADSEYERWRP